MFKTLDAVRTGRLSPATLAGTVWVLRAWDLTVPAASEPVVTLSYDAGRFTGTSGCNRYFAGVEGGAMPGEVKVGPLAGTRMACPEPQSSVEARFLEQLGSARTFGFMVGRLAISYTRGDGSRGTMLFDASTPAKGRRSPYRGRSCSRGVAHSEVGRASSRSLPRLGCDRRHPQGVPGPSRLGPWSYRSAFAFGASLGASMNNPARRMSARPRLALTLRRSSPRVAVRLLAGACATPIGVTLEDTQSMDRSLTSSVLPAHRPSLYSERGR